MVGLWRPLDLPRGGGVTYRMDLVFDGASGAPHPDAHQKKTPQGGESNKRASRMWCFLRNSMNGITSNGHLGQFLNHHTQRTALFHCTHKCLEIKHEISRTFERRSFPQPNIPVAKPPSLYAVEGPQRPYKLCLLPMATDCVNNWFEASGVINTCFNQWSPLDLLDSTKKICIELRQLGTHAQCFHGSARYTLGLLPHAKTVRFSTPSLT